MPSESLNALAAAHIPKLAGSVNGASEAVVACEIKLATRKLSLMTLESEDALA